MNKKYKYLVIIIILEIILSAIIFFRFNDVAYNGDALYEAQVARNVLAGKGYVTSEMPLYAVDLYQRKGMSLEAPWINTHKFPLPVYIKAVFIKIFGDNLASVTFFYSYFFHFLSLILIYYIGLKIWSGKSSLAFLSAIIFLINPVLGFGTPYLMMSGLNLIVDSFIFLLLLLVIYFWEQKKSNLLLFLAGLISGIAFLDRYNSGLFIVAVFIMMFYLLILKHYRERPLKNLIIQFIKKYIVYFSGFIFVIAGLVIWNIKNIGQPFMSINGYFQLFHDTSYAAFMDGWYKLEYIFPTDNPFGYALSHFGAITAFVIKCLKYLFLDIVRLSAFEGVLWWTPLVLGYFLISRQKNKEDRSLEKINFFMLFTGILIILQLLILPVWAGSIAYFLYLFPVFSFAIAYFLNFIYQKIPDLNLNKTKKWIDLFKRVGDQIVGNGIIGITIFLLIISSLILLILLTFFKIFVFLGVQSYLIVAFSLFLLFLIGLIAFWYHKFLPAVFVLLGLVYFIVQAGIFSDISKAEILRLRWDLENNPQNIKNLKTIDKGGIVISMTPWNVVWWSGNQLNALPLPEYPDEIYWLEKNYGQKIDTIYLNKIIKYPFKYISYSWAAYQRAIQFGYAFEGFAVFQRLPEGIILKRDPSFFPEVTKIIDFGKDSANSHLIWGWGANENDGKRDYVSAGDYNYLIQTKEIFQGTRRDEKKVIKENNEKEVFDIILRSDNMKTYYKPDAEVSFLADSDSNYNKIEIMLKSLTENQNMKVILNGNLLYVGQEGVDLGDFKVSTDWQSLVINIDSAYLHDGINKISFVFSSVFSEEKNLEGKIMQDNKFALFDYIKFYND